jgi:hypothetical protein
MTLSTPVAQQKRRGVLDSDFRSDSMNKNKRFGCTSRKIHTAYPDRVSRYEQSRIRDVRDRA